MAISRLSWPDKHIHSANRGSAQGYGGANRGQSFALVDNLSLEILTALRNSICGGPSRSTGVKPSRDPDLLRCCVIYRYSRAGHK